MRDNFAVVGFPIKHSKSPKIHPIFAKKLGFNLQYDAIEIDPRDFNEVELTDKIKDLLNEYKGLNLTIPFKEIGFTLADNYTKTAGIVKAANTLKKNGSTIEAHNSDGIGFIADILSQIANNAPDLFLQQARILVLGSGGAARGVLGALLDYQVSHVDLAARNFSTLETLATDFKKNYSKGINTLHDFGSLSKNDNYNYDIIINATSSSLLKQKSALPDSLWRGIKIGYDLFYTNNKSNTTFLSQVAEVNNKAFLFDGKGMLFEQAKEAFKFWYDYDVKMSAKLQDISFKDHLGKIFSQD